MEAAARACAVRLTIDLLEKPPPAASIARPKLLDGDAPVTEVWSLNY